MMKEDIPRLRCMCGRWCIDITKITTEIKQKGDLTAIEVSDYGDRLIERCINGR